MNRPALALIAALALIPLPVMAQHHHDMPMPSSSDGVPLYTDLGTWTHPVTTTVPKAQQYFDQGLRLYYGFNQDEATRAFREAARLDPDCAMAWWGVAITAGPDINIPMDPDHAKIASEALAKAMAGRLKVGDADRAYIEALSVRYSNDSSASRAGLDSAYAGAMRTLAAKFPNDVDAQALYAESMMVLNPWNQWTHDGDPNPGTLEIVSVLEAAMKAHPEHPGANHFYIHAVEASPHPERATAAAERLGSLEPGAGHLVHMPSHIYARTGRYEDSRMVNRKAVAVDEKYIAEQKPQGLYPMMYYNHNIQFIWFSAGLEGRSAEALECARKIVGHIPPEMLRQMSMLEMVPPITAATLVHFGRWEEALEEPAPLHEFRYSTAISNYARGVAFAALGRFNDAEAALDTVNAIATTVPADQMVSINYAAPLLRLASHALAGEIAWRKKQLPTAIAELEAAVAAEDSLHYDEPPTWFYAERPTLGAVLLDAGQASKAEAVYREDLKRDPENGWSLFGLAQALRAQGREADAKLVDTSFKKAWAKADTKLTASSF